MYKRLYRLQKNRCFVSGHDFTRSGRTHALYQGTTLVGPLSPNNDMGFSPWAFPLTFLVVVEKAPAHCSETFPQRLRAGRAPTGAEAQSFSLSYGPTKVVP